MNPACLICKRHLPPNENYAISSTHLTKDSRPAPTDVLVVYSHPDAEDDATGLPMQAPPYKELILGPLSKTPWSIVITSMVLCYQPKKPTPTQLNICHDNFFSPRLREQYKPKVIWAIGAEVARKLLKSELTLDKIRRLGVAYTEDGVPVVVLESPWMHAKYKSIKDGGRDLVPDIKRKLELTHNILVGKYKPQDAEFTLCSTYQEAVEAADFLRAECYPAYGFDTECGLQRNTNFCENSERVLYLTDGICSKHRRTGEYHTFVVDHENWSKSARMRYLEHLLTGQVPIATEAFFDFNLLWWQGGVDVYDICPSWHDLKIASWAQNQRGLRNGLEDQCVDWLGWAEWKADFDELKARAEKNLVIPPDSLLEHVDYRHVKWEFPQPFYKYQALDARGTAGVWYERYADQEDPTKMAAKFNLNGYRLSNGYLKLYSYISRLGVPINLDYLKRYQEANLEVEEKYNRWLATHPITTRVFPGQELNTKSAPQMHQLCVALGIETRSKTKKTEEMQVNQDELLRLSNSEFQKDILVRKPRPTKSAEKHVQDFWYAILQARLNRDKNSKSQQLLDFAQPGRGWINRDGEELHRLHPMFKIGKSAGGHDAKEGKGINTGRISSIWPSMGNVSKEELLRAGIEAPTGYVICEWDLSAIEPRVFGYLAGEQSWQRIFELQADPATSADPRADIYRMGWVDYQALQGVSMHPGDISAETREEAKILILRLCYDSSPNGITKSYGLPIDLTTKFAEGFWKNYTALQAFAYAARKQIIEKNGWLVSAAGRRAQYKLYNRYQLDDDLHWNLPLWKLQRELKPRMSETDAETMRAGFNSLIQGTADSINTTALMDVEELRRKEGWKYFAFFNSVHDSGWALVEENMVDEADKLVTGYQTDAARLLRHGINIPFPTDPKRPRILRNSLKVGYNMGEMKAIRK